ncbi:MAG TPA: GntR family transcriptional regulator [Ramlibacter sp.]|nr:GntR family transcriptional regulator [Ramlibacter sp.]
MNTPLSKVEQSDSLADKARKMIRAAIFEGQIQPDERLTIEHLAAQLGISRTPVREALKALETDGIVKLLPNRGAIVQSFSREEWADRFQVRAVLEGLAGELACRNQGRKLGMVLAAIQEKIVEGMKQAKPDDLVAASKLVALNSEFHGAILQASGSETTARMLEALRMPMAYRLYHWRSPERQNAHSDFHFRIIQAFLAEDPAEVRRLLEAHILEGRNFVLRED